VLCAAAHAALALSVITARLFTYAARFEELSKMKDTYKIVVIEGAGIGETVQAMRVASKRQLLCRTRLRWCPDCNLLRARSSADATSAALPFDIADMDKKQIIATATLVVELKFIRGCSKCGHIEDVVVDSTYRGLRLGLRVIEALMTAAQASSKQRAASRRQAPSRCSSSQGQMANSALVCYGTCSSPAGAGVLQSHSGLQRGQRAFLRKMRPR
jgi:GNAT superfamily N-acetyltransferase